MNRFEDNYYRKWPFPVTDEEVAAEGYLKSLTAPEELAGSWGHGVIMGLIIEILLS